MKFKSSLVIAPVTNKAITYTNPPNPIEAKVNSLLEEIIIPPKLNVSHTVIAIITVDNSGSAATFTIPLNFIGVYFLISLKFKKATTKYVIAVLNAAPLIFIEGIEINIYDNIVFIIKPIKRFLTGINCLFTDSSLYCYASISKQTINTS